MKRKAVAISVVTTSFGLGAAIVVPLLTLGISHLGWRETLRYQGVFFCLLTLAMFLVVRSKPEDLGMRPDGDVHTPLETADRRRAAAASQSRAEEPPKTGSPTDKGQEFRVREALRTRSYWFLLLGNGTRASVADGLIILQVPMLVWKGFDEQTAAFFVALMFFTMIPLRLGLGLAANAIPPRLVFGWHQLGRPGSGSYVGL